MGGTVCLRYLTPSTECAMNFYPLLKLPPFFYLYFYRQKIKNKISSRQRKKRKNPKMWGFFRFWALFWGTKWGLSKRSARLCTGRSRCGYKGERGGEAKKRYRDTERARDGPKRHANYGPSLPVSIPTLGESLAQVWLAQTPAFPEGLLGVKDGWRKGWWHRADTLIKK